MKQHITPEQSDELSIEAHRKLAEWRRKNGYSNDRAELPLLTIGQMIEFLDEDNRWEMTEYKPFKHGTGYKDIPWDNKQELCDALWEAVKEVLNDKT